MHTRAVDKQAQQAHVYGHAALRAQWRLEFARRGQAGEGRAVPPRPRQARSARCPCARLGNCTGSPGCDYPMRHTPFANLCLDEPSFKRNEEPGRYVRVAEYSVDWK
jgi:hypothetical protein